MSPITIHVVSQESTYHAVAILKQAEIYRLENFHSAEVDHDNEDLLKVCLALGKWPSADFNH
jgi:hypothetical protein